jgi:hypothetical protein
MIDDGDDEIVLIHSSENKMNTTDSFALLAAELSKVASILVSGVVLTLLTAMMKFTEGRRATGKQTEHLEATVSACLAGSGSGGSARSGSQPGSAAGAVKKE